VIRNLYGALAPVVNLRVTASATYSE